MDRDWVKVLIGAMALLVLLVVGGLIFVYSGAYNVAASKEHTGFMTWLLETTMEHSVSARADDVGAPPPLGPADFEHGFEHFHAMCVECHGAPGVERGEFGQGLNPVPPELSEEAGEWSDREVFWIVKHGIKMSGMPAFGPTHTDDEIWGIVGFVNTVLPQISPAEYQRLAAELEARGGGHHDEGGEAGGEGEGHTHAPGAPAHEH